MLKRLRAIFDFLLYTHVFIGFIAITLSLLTYRIFKIPINWKLMGFIFISTLTAYNFSIANFGQKGSHSDGSIRQNLIGKFYLPFKIFIILGMLAILGLAFFLPQKSLGILLIESIVAFFYSVPILRFHKTWVPLRKIPQLKIWILSLLWTISTLVIPLWISPITNLFSLPQFYIQTLRVFLFIFVNALLFDIRDLAIDQKTNLITLPGILGIKNTKRLAYILIFLFGILNFISIPFFGMETAWAYNFTVLILLFLTYQIRENRTEFFYMFYLDGALITPFIFIWIMDLLKIF